MAVAPIKLIFAHKLQIMKNKIYTFLMAICAMLFATSCEEAAEGIQFENEEFPIGSVTWSSSVSDADKAVIRNLLNNMVLVEQCDFYMGAQSRNYGRANYFSGYSSRDTVWYNKKLDIAYSRVLKTADTTWYNPRAFEFIDSLKTKKDTLHYAIISRMPSNYWVGPVVKVKMPSFCIGKFEITQAEWMAVMHKEPTGKYSIVPDLTGTASWFEPIGKGDNIPAYNIWYSDAVAFCEALSAQTGLKFRLPTEAEWECAARGGKYSRGYRYMGADTYSECGWTDSNSASKKMGNEDYGIHAGGELTANELGIYDMCGNVSEWVGNAYYKYSWLDCDNPQGKAVKNDGTDTLIIRGGSWMQKMSSDFGPSSRRHVVVANYPTEQSKQSAFVNCGMRIVFSLQENIAYKN